MGELLGTLGLAWPRLLIYPGGLFALGAGWLLGRWFSIGGAPARPAAPLTPNAVIDLMPPLAALTLLPLAPARPFPFGLDLPLTLALLEWPRIRALAARTCHPAALLQDYAPLLAATLALAVATGGVELTRLLNWPETAPARALLLLGAGLWLSGLPRLWKQGPAGMVGGLRALGLLLVGVLPLLGSLASVIQPWAPTSLTGWMAPPLAMLGAISIVSVALRLAEQWIVRVQITGAGAILALAAYAASTVR